MMTDASAPSDSPTPPEILLLQEMTDASFRQMDQDRMLRCCAAGLTRNLGGQGAAILVEELQSSWFLQIFSAAPLPDPLLKELQDLCFDSYNRYSPQKLLPENCRVEVEVSKNAGPSPSRLHNWTALPLEVDEKFQGLLLVDLAGSERLPAKLDVVLHQLCTGLLSIRNMRQLLITDPMTGCCNRWFMDIELSKFCEGNLHQQDTFAVMILDIDHFKQINDRYGHSSGDRILVELAEMLREHLSPGDAAIRMGGDEFLIWFPRVRGRNLFSLGEDLLRKVRRELKLELAPEHPVTLSVGLVLHGEGEPEISKEQLLERADHALYASKRKGRNQLNLWTPQLENWPLPESGIPQEESTRIRELENRIQELQTRSLQDQENLIDLLNNLLSLKEYETGLHSFRVAAMTAHLLDHLDLPVDEKTAIYRGAKLHDIGKIAIPEAILHKQGKLSEAEWTIIRQHPQLGKRILENQEFLSAACEIVHCHHEHFDGSGYPRGLKGEEIPFGARLFCLVDAYDSMRANRVYKTSVSRQDAVEELRRKSGTQFDPELLDFFLSHLPELEKIGHWE